MILLPGLLPCLRRRSAAGTLSHHGGMRIILWLGAIGPALILGALLLYALPAMRSRDTAPGDLTIRVEGEQCWWRGSYPCLSLTPVLRFCSM